MQSYEMRESDAERLLAEMMKEHRQAVVHHEQLNGGRARIKTVVMGKRMSDVHAALDRAQAEAERFGAVNFHRTRIGRNSPCPCGSGLKFKKCCIDKAPLVG